MSRLFRRQIAYKNDLKIRLPNCNVDIHKPNPVPLLLNEEKHKFSITKRKRTNRISINIARR